MCGIAGIWSKGIFSGQELAEICRQMSASLRHRGPDDEGFVLFDTDGNAEIFGGDDSNKSLSLKHISSANRTYKGALIHRRLSIISPGPEGHQPMQTDGGKYWIVYNGETFNYKELDTRFGIQNRSNNDAETVLELVSKNAAEAHRLLDGFHAFAVYDTEEKKLTLYRDRTGVKPLFYAQNEDCFVFASETKTLRKWAGFQAINEAAVFHMLSEGIQIPGLELLRGISEVDYEVVWDAEDPDIAERTADTRMQPPGLTLEAAVGQAVKSRLMSDVPLGFAVSGGLDSAIIIGAARKELGMEADLKLFSIVSDDADSDESYWQEKVAKFNKAEWHKTSTADFTGDMLQQVTITADMPPVAWNNIAQFELARSARAGGITVFLNGQGADEIFGGYPDYLFRYFLKHPFASVGDNLPLTANEMIQGSLKLLLKRTLPQGVLKKQFLRQQNGWLTPELEVHDPYVWGLSNLSADDKMLWDYYGQRLRQMLRWEDLNGMAHHLESRNPFADNAVLASWLKVPMREKLKNGFTKGILRNAVKELVPEEVLWRVDKKGFTVPDAKLTWKCKDQWQDAFMSRDLDPYSPRAKREAAWKKLTPVDTQNLQWYFRLSALAYYLDNLKK